MIFAGENSKNEAADLDAFRVLISRDDFSHVSYRSWCGVNFLHVYIRKQESPSGCWLIGSVIDNDDARTILASAGRGAQQGGLMGEGACRNQIRGR